MTPPPAAAALADLYAELDRALARLGLPCRACGACCHFESAGHTLYASRLELDHLLLHAGPGTPPAPDRCPYQTREACTAHAARVLGCRLHFCQAPPAARLALEALSAQAHRRLQQIHVAHGLPWRYAPLLKTLADLVSTSR